MGNDLFVDFPAGCWLWGYTQPLQRFSSYLVTYQTLRKRLPTERRMDRRGRGGVSARGRGVAVLRVRAVGRLPRAERARRRGYLGLRVRSHPQQEEADRHGRPVGAARRCRGHQHYDSTMTFNHGLKYWSCPEGRALKFSD